MTYWREEWAAKKEEELRREAEFERMISNLPWPLEVLYYVTIYAIVWGALGFMVVASIGGLIFALPIQMHHPEWLPWIHGSQIILFGLMFINAFWGGKS